MIKVTEFRNVNDLNDYLSKINTQCQVIAMNREFTNPKTMLLTSTINYVLVESYDDFKDPSKRVRA